MYIPLELIVTTFKQKHLKTNINKHSLSLSHNDCHHVFSNITDQVIVYVKYNLSTTTESDQVKIVNFTGCSLLSKNAQVKLVSFYCNILTFINLVIIRNV